MASVPRIRFALVWGAAAASLAACAVFGSSANESASPEGVDAADAGGDGAASDEAADAATLEVPVMEPVDAGLDAAALRRIWVSSGERLMGFGLRQKAEERCARDATERELVGRGVPLLSSDGRELRAEIADDLTYARPDGTIVGKGRELLEGRLAAPIAPDSGILVWTGATREGGVATENDCASWRTRESTTLRGASGRAGATSSEWLAHSNPKCDSLQRVYCVEKR